VVADRHLDWEGCVILATLASLDVEAALRAGGLGDDEMGAVRARLLGPALT